MSAGRESNQDRRTKDFAHITTVIFDMDGTLIHHTWRLNQITEALFTRFAAQLAPVTHDEFYELFWPKNADMWYMMVDGVLDGDTAARYSYINTLRTLKLDVALAEPMLAYWHELVLNEALPFEDTFEVLDAVRKHYTTGILTNGFSALQWGKIKRHNLADHVDFVLVSEEVGYHKPDPQVFIEALKEARNALPHQTLYIGDNPVADIQGAGRAGLVPIFIGPEDNQVEIPPEVIKITQLEELLTLLKIK